MCAPGCGANAYLAKENNEGRENGSFTKFTKISKGNYTLNLHLWSKTNNLQHTTCIGHELESCENLLQTS